MLFYYILNDFLKYDNNQLLEVTTPDNWDGIDYSFLINGETSVYNKCESIPSLYQIIYGEIVSLMNSKLIESHIYP